MNITTDLRSLDLLFTAVSPSYRTRVEPEISPFYHGRPAYASSHLMCPGSDSGGVIHNRFKQYDILRKKPFLNQYHSIPMKEAGID